MLSWMDMARRSLESPDASTTITHSGRLGFRRVSAILVHADRHPWCCREFKAVPGWRLFVARCTNTRCNAWILGNATRACTLSDDNYGGDQHALAYPHSVGWRRRASVGRRLLYPPCNPCVSLN